MKKLLLVIIPAILYTTGFSQISGIKTIPGDYVSIAEAISVLNTEGVGEGGVVYNVSADYSETTTAPILLTATGTASNTVTFQKTGSGNNPIITRTDAGTIETTATGGQGDAVIIIEGAAYVTFDAIDVQAVEQGIEYGFYLRKAGPDQGCKFITIRNANITMNKGTSNFVTGIIASNNDSSSPANNADGITVTSLGGRNENISLYGNTISNVFIGIYLRGFNDPVSPFDFYDQNFEIGKEDQGNNIFNFAGATAVNSFGVFSIYHNNLSILNNNINNTAGGGSPFLGNGFGIFTFSAINASVDISYNEISLSGAGTTQEIRAISNAAGSNGTSNQVSINWNKILNCSQPNATTGAFTGIVNSATAAALDVSNNIVSNNTQAGTGDFTAINGGGGTSTTLNMQNNTINGNQKTGASGQIFCLRGDGGIVTVSENHIFDNSFTNSSGTGVCRLYGYFNTGSPVLEEIFDNNFYNLAINGINTSTATVLMGISTSATANTEKNIFGNKIYDLLTVSGTATGISQSLGINVRIFRNEIYNISNTTGATTLGRVNGITIGSGTCYVYNNFISKLYAPNAAGDDAVRTITINSSTANSVVGIYYNTLYLDAVSTGANFGSSVIYHTFNTNLTTAALDLRNNIIVNVSQPNGSGNTVALKRSSSTNLNNYAEESNNNAYYAGVPGPNNLIFAEGFGAGIVKYQTMEAYQAKVSPRESASFRELPPFEDLTRSAHDLRLKSTVATQCESGGQRITDPISVTDDFFGTIRANEVGYFGVGSAPDIGAHEGDFIGLDLIPPIISYTPLPITSLTGPRTLVAEISDLSGVPNSGVGLPVLYWKPNSIGTYTATTAVFLGEDLFEFTFGDGVQTGDQVEYFIVAQDMIEPEPNVGSMPVGAGGFTFNPPAAAIPPPNPDTYTIAEGLAGIYTVGVGDADFQTLTGAGGLFAHINNNLLAGDVIAEIVSDITEPGTHALNRFAEEGNGTFNLLIRPNAAENRTLSGESINGLIRLNGAQRTTIDGSFGRSNERYLTIQNTSPFANRAAIQLISNGPNNGVENIKISNCNIAAGNNLMTSSFGIFLGGPTISTAGSGADNSNVVIENNAIYKAYNGIFARGTTSGLLQGLEIRGNLIGSELEDDFIIFRGIDIQNAEAPVVANNEIFNMQAATNVTIAAIDLGQFVSDANVSGNKIYGMRSTAAAGHGTYGINISSNSGTSNILIANNVMYDFETVGDGTSTIYNPFGIRVTGGSNHKIYYNSIRFGGSFTNPTKPNISAAMIVTSTNATGLDVRNNVFYNEMEGNTLTKCYGIYAASGVTFSVIDHNDYYVSGDNGILGFGGSDKTTLAEWQTLTGQDMNSISADPLFSTDTELMPLEGSPLISAGTPLVLVNADFNGVVRSPVQPTIGAYEFQGEIPENLNLTEETLIDSFSCYNALENITVAGDGNEFVVVDGGSLLLIAGGSIVLKPGFRVEAGGIFHGYIDNVFCNELKTDANEIHAIAPIPEILSAIAINQDFMKVYPNPADGYIGVLINSETEINNLSLEIFSVLGETVLHQQLKNQQAQTINIGNLKSGIYIVKVILNDSLLNTCKIIKR